MSSATALMAVRNLSFLQRFFIHNALMNQHFLLGSSPLLMATYWQHTVPARPELEKPAWPELEKPAHTSLHLRVSC
ncbi:hypothetical protein V1264_023815 [Littorina saxatilis]|uniref:Uncharacterized protein n=1 Tax=Littorina saxatilis TaxID=31220 RepID=A0AAN9GBN4_9CAEN